MKRFWEQIRTVDLYLDAGVAEIYKAQPLAQDWARVAKLTEEAGEAIAELILYTGQNPRKPQDDEAKGRMLDELADTACTALLGIQHFTKDTRTTEAYLLARMGRIHERCRTPT